MAIVVLIILVIDFLLCLFWPRHRVLTKCLLMPLLLAFYLLQAVPIDLLVVLALVAAWIGDFCLTKTDKLFVQLGICAFLICHGLYAFIFLWSTSFLTGVPLWFYMSFLLYLIAVWLLYSRIKKDLGDFQIGFFIYCAGICFMSLMALARVFSVAPLAFWLPFIGSLFFLVSDAILSFNIFQRKQKFSSKAVMTTYVAAQVLIISGLLIK